MEGVLIFQFVAPLCYLNVGVFRSRILIESKVDPLASLNTTEDGCFMKGYLKVRFVCGVRYVVFLPGGADEACMICTRYSRCQCVSLGLCQLECMDVRCAVVVEFSRVCIACCY